MGGTNGSEAIEAVTLRQAQTASNAAPGAVSSTSKPAGVAGAWTYRPAGGVLQVGHARWSFCAFVNMQGQMFKVCGAVLAVHNLIRDSSGRLHRTLSGNEMLQAVQLLEELLEAARSFGARRMQMDATHRLLTCGAGVHVSSSISCGCILAGHLDEVLKHRMRHKLPQVTAL